MSGKFFQVTAWGCFLFVTLGGACSYAQTIQISPSPVILGGGATYTVQGPFPGQPATFYWDYRWDDMCVSGWGPLSSNPNFQVQNVGEAYAGTFDIRCTITYNSVMGHPAPPPSVLTTSLTIAPPTGVRIANPAVLNTNIGVNNVPPSPTSILGCTGVTVVFTIQSNGQDCGQYITGQPQEYVTNKVLFGVNKPNDPGWTPPGYDARFFLGPAPNIQDFKQVPAGSPDYAAWPNNSVFFTRTQNLQFLQTDPCGNVRTYSLGSVNFQSVKINNTTWQLQRP